MAKFVPFGKKKGFPPKGKDKQKPLNAKEKALASANMMGSAVKKSMPKEHAFLKKQMGM